MKIQFTNDQAHQQRAVRAVVALFDGQPLAPGGNEVAFNPLGGELFSELGVGNALWIDQERLLRNVQRVQAGNGLAVTEALAGMHFSLEMETGTGKTYAYLRTIHELHKQYGFKKFVIVVPSVAIREGVMKSIDLTRDHFRQEFGNVPLDAWVFDAKQASKLRGFAQSTGLQVLIINVDAFNKKEINVIHRESDRMSGRRPIEFIQGVSPVVVLDEPQNMESEAARAAIASLNPLCTLRYSATHRNPYNLLYRLDPVQAYALALVKRIGVYSIVDGEDFNAPYIGVESITSNKSKITAKLKLDVQKKGMVSRKGVAVSKNGVNLAELTGREHYQGYIVAEINATPGRAFIRFGNGVRLSPGQAHGSHRDDVMAAQVRQTIRQHLEHELFLHQRQPPGQRLKVLSLLFIDRVAHYTHPEGKIRRWFEDAYRELAAEPAYAPLQLPPVERVHNGYFAQDRSGAKDTSGRTKADDEAYHLIMQDKERLLERGEPLRFIFSHSALREGWDNPNVFQICTLNESRSEMRKRQEIGRGLRLPVMENGQRCHDPAVNRLTVIANESYADFAATLQREIQEECGVTFAKEHVVNERNKRRVKLKPDWRLDPLFQALWQRIQQKTRYSVHYDTATLIQQAAEAIRGMPAIDPPRLSHMEVGIEMAAEGVQATLLSARQEALAHRGRALPDVVGYLQREMELTRGALTRSALAQILVESGRLGDVLVNPQLFLEESLKALSATLDAIITHGIKYERIEGDIYEMLLFEGEEVERFVESLVAVGSSITDVIAVDSQVERDFATGLDQRRDVPLFLKLPSWFKIRTPVGDYNPDWALVKEDGERLYLVRETKGSTDPLALRLQEHYKIRCGEAHFAALGVDFRVVTSAQEV